MDWRDDWQDIPEEMSIGRGIMARVEKTPAETIADRISEYLAEWVQEDMPS